MVSVHFMQISILQILRNGQSVLIELVDEHIGMKFHKQGLRPRASSLMMSLEGTLVMNAEL
jgi:hypothetical protein